MVYENGRQLMVRDFALYVINAAQKSVDLLIAAAFEEGPEPLLQLSLSKAGARIADDTRVLWKNPGACSAR